MAEYGRHVSLWRRVLGVAPRQTWHDRHPLPAGWRPRTRIDEVGREVEPWGYTVLVGRHTYDAGEWWLPVGRDPDEAAYLILERWLAQESGLLAAWELRQVRCAARRATRYDGRAGLACVEETSLTA